MSKYDRYDGTDWNDTFYDPLEREDVSSGQVFEENHETLADKFDSDTAKIAMGGIAAAGLLTGIYVLAHRRLKNRGSE